MRGCRSAAPCALSGDRVGLWQQTHGLHSPGPTQGFSKPGLMTPGIKSQVQKNLPFSHTTGGAAYLLYMSRALAGSCACVTSLLWLVALRYGAFQRKSQRLFQDALADTGQVAEEVRSSICMENLLRCAVRSCTTPYQAAKSTTATFRHVPVQYRGNARIPSAAQKAHRSCFRLNTYWRWPFTSTPACAAAGVHAVAGGAHVWHGEAGGGALQQLAEATDAPVRAPGGGLPHVPHHQQWPVLPDQGVTSIRVSRTSEWHGESKWREEDDASRACIAPMPHHQQWPLLPRQCGLERNRRDMKVAGPA